MTRILKNLPPTLLMLLCLVLSSCKDKFHKQAIDIEKSIHLKPDSLKSLSFKKDEFDFYILEYSSINSFNEEVKAKSVFIKSYDSSKLNKISVNAYFGYSEIIKLYHFHKNGSKSSGFTYKTMGAHEMTVELCRYLVGKNNKIQSAREAKDLYKTIEEIKKEIEMGKS